MRWKKTRKPFPMHSKSKAPPQSEEERKLPPPKPVDDDPPEDLSESLTSNIDKLKELLSSDDVVFRVFALEGVHNIKAVLIFIDGLVDKDQLHRDLLRPLMLPGSIVYPEEFSRRPEELDEILYRTLTMSETKKIHTLQECVEGVINADAVLLVDGSNTGILLGVKSWEHRGIAEPDTEQVVRGPREGFNELFKSNLALVRRRIKSPNLRVKFAMLGRRTRTDIALVYEEGIANPKLVDEVYKRLSYIDVDAIMDSGYVEQYIEDSPHSPFPQVQYTERPDRVAAALLEGRIAIFVDGSPLVLLVPTVLANLLTSPEDHYERWILMSAVRLIRAASILIAILLPALYVAIVTFHQEMIPTRLAIAIAGSREGVPFPALAEAIIMELTFELLREGGIRVPGAVGQTIGIVGGIIIGQAAVTAGLVSPIMVIVVALTAIGSFAVPAFNVGLSLRMLRFPLILLAGTFGIYGVFAGVILVLLHMVSLTSFGVPYMAPLTPMSNEGLRDTLVRFPLWMINRRPSMFKTGDKTRVERPAFVQHHKEGKAGDGGDDEEQKDES